MSAIEKTSNSNIVPIRDGDNGGATEPTTPRLAPPQTLPLPSFSDCYPERPFADDGRPRRPERYLTEKERRIIDQCLPVRPERGGIIKPLRTFLLTKNIPLAECRTLTWDEIIDQLAAILQQPVGVVKSTAEQPVAPVQQSAAVQLTGGFWSLKEIQRHFQFDARIHEMVKKRLARWRRDNEEKCRRVVDSGTGRELWTYPAAIVEKLTAKLSPMRPLKRPPEKFDGIPAGK